jgi:hypothetical protein
MCATSSRLSRDISRIMKRIILLIVLIITASTLSTIYYFRPTGALSTPDVVHGICGQEAEFESLISQYMRKAKVGSEDEVKNFWIAPPSSYLSLEISEMANKMPDRASQEPGSETLPSKLPAYPVIQRLSYDDVVINYPAIIKKDNITFRSVLSCKSAGDFTVVPISIDVNGITMQISFYVAKDQDENWKIFKIAS